MGAGRESKVQNLNYGLVLVLNNRWRKLCKSGGFEKEKKELKLKQLNWIFEKRVKNVTKFVFDNFFYIDNF